MIKRERANLQVNDYHIVKRKIANHYVFFIQDQLSNVKRKQKIIYLEI